MLVGKPAQCSGAHLMSIWYNEKGSTYPKKVAQTGIAGGKNQFKFGSKGALVSQKIALVWCWKLTHDSDSANSSLYGMTSLRCRQHHTVGTTLSTFATGPFTTFVRTRVARVRKPGITK